MGPFLAFAPGEGEAPAVGGDEREVCVFDFPEDAVEGVARILARSGKDDAVDHGEEVIGFEGESAGVGEPGNAGEVGGIVAEHFES